MWREKGIKEEADPVKVGVIEGSEIWSEPDISRGIWKNILRERLRSTVVPEEGKDNGD